MEYMETDAHPVISRRSMVIPMNTWMEKYCNVTEFLSFFENEQDYVDAMFVHMIMFNFGVCIHTDHLLRNT